MTTFGSLSSQPAYLPLPPQPPTPPSPPKKKACTGQVFIWWVPSSTSSPCDNSEIFLLLFQAEKTAHMKAETKERTLKRFLLSQKHIVYTDPLDVQAGTTVTVFYNPANTVLNGKSEIWFRCSFNHWTHRMGILPPQKMVPVEYSTHVKTTGE